MGLQRVRHSSLSTSIRQHEMLSMPNFGPRGLENKPNRVHLRYYTKTFFFFYFERNDVNEFSETKPHFKEEMCSQFGDVSKDSIRAYKKEWRSQDVNNAFPVKDCGQYSYPKNKSHS